MCFFLQQTKTATELKHRRQAGFPEANEYHPKAFVNAFGYPKVPVISNGDTKNIQLFNWGLLPAWAKNPDIRKYTLNARIESLHEKPSFRNITQNRCLVLTSGFYEWQHLDKQEKKKQKYLIGMKDEELFALAGLWTENRHTNYKSFTIITTQANNLMSKIHNTKKRMPVILNKELEAEWLRAEKTPDFFKTPNIDLKAQAV